MSTHAQQASIPKEEPDDDPDDVLFNTIYGVRTIELNRPKKLNSLNGSMARKIIPRLKVYFYLYNVLIIVVLFISIILLILVCRNGRNRN